MLIIGYIFFKRIMENMSVFIILYYILHAACTF